MSIKILFYHPGEFVEFIQQACKIPYKIRRDRLGRFEYYEIVIGNIKIHVRGTIYTLTIFNKQGMYEPHLNNLITPLSRNDLLLYKVVIKRFINYILKENICDSNKV